VPTALERLGLRPHHVKADLCIRTILLLRRRTGYHPIARSSSASTNALALMTSDAKLDCRLIAPEPRTESEGGIVCSRAAGPGSARRDLHSARRQLFRPPSGICARAPSSPGAACLLPSPQNPGLGADPSQVAASAGAASGNLVLRLPELGFDHLRYPQAKPSRPAALFAVNCRYSPRRPCFSLTSASLGTPPSTAVGPQFGFRR